MPFLSKKGVQNWLMYSHLFLTKAPFPSNWQSVIDRMQNGTHNTAESRPRDLEPQPLYKYGQQYDYFANSAVVLALVIANALGKTSLVAQANVFGNEKVLPFLSGVILKAVKKKHEMVKSLWKKFVMDDFLFDEHEKIMIAKSDLHKLLSGLMSFAQVMRSTMYKDKESPLTLRSIESARMSPINHLVQWMEIADVDILRKYWLDSFVPLFAGSFPPETHEFIKQIHTCFLLDAVLSGTVV